MSDISDPNPETLTVSSKTVSVKLPSKRTLLIVIAALVVFSILVISIASLQRHNEKQARLAAFKADEIARVEKARTKELNDLKTALKVSESKRIGSCEYISKLTKTPVVQRYVVVPNVYCL